jgi:hypothetical protein
MQTIELLLKIDDNVDLYTCEGGGAPTPSLADENYTMLSGQATGSNSQKARLIVASQEWLLHRNDFTSAISMAHPRNGQTPIRNQCRIKIMLARVSLPFVVKSIVLTIFIVFGSLGFAVLLHPDELIGDRAAVLFVAFLILATNIQTDLGLGTVSYLLWVDIFNGIQLTIIFGVILQTSTTLLPQPLPGTDNQSPHAPRGLSPCWLQRCTRMSNAALTMRRCAVGSARALDGQVFDGSHPGHRLPV